MVRQFSVLSLMLLSLFQIGCTPKESAMGGNFKVTYLAGLVVSRVESLSGLPGLSEDEEKKSKVSFGTTFSVRVSPSEHQLDGKAVKVALDLALKGGVAAAESAIVAAFTSNLQERGVAAIAPELVGNPEPNPYTRVMIELADKETAGRCPKQDDDENGRDEDPSSELEPTAISTTYGALGTLPPLDMSDFCVVVSPSSPAWEPPPPPMGNLQINNFQLLAGKGQICGVDDEFSDPPTSCEYISDDSRLVSYTNDFENETYLQGAACCPVPNDGTTSSVGSVCQPHRLGQYTCAQMNDLIPAP